MAVRYVTITGSSSNSGTDEANAWSWNHALANAVAGDIVYVKAGDYGTQKGNQTNNGTASNPIQFIGYQNTPNDISAIERTLTYKGETYNFWSTYTRGEIADGSKTPYFNGGAASTSNNTFLNTGGNYVVYKNLAITGYMYGITAGGSNVTVENLYIYELGDIYTPHSQVAYTDGGFGIRMDGGSNYTVSKTYVRDCGGENITIASGTNNMIEYSFAESMGPDRGFPNSSDYYLSYAGNSTFSEIQHCLVFRFATNDHTGHGIDMKSNSHDNYIHDCNVIGTYLEVKGSGSYNNLFENCTIVGNYRDSNAPGSEYGNIFVASGAHDNTFRNIELSDDFCPIRLIIGGDNSLGSFQEFRNYNNLFQNITITNCNNAIGFFESEGDSSYDNVFDGITVDGCDQFIRSNNTNSGNIFRNISINNTPYFKSGSVTLNTNTVFENINLSGNSFSASEFAPYVESNITEYDVTFDSKFRPLSNTIDLGTIVSSTYATDKDGNTRTNPITYGAYEFDTSTQPTVPPPTRYVNTVGGGDGSSTSSTWTITQAFNNAVAGDVVYIQAGSYGNVNLVQSNNGTSTNRIQFIGCDSSWNPVDSSTPSFWNKDVFDDRIPFLDGGLQDGQRASNGKGFIVNGNFVTLNNICFKGFEQGGDWNGDDGIAYNLSTDYMGTMVEDNSTSQDWDPVTGDYLGRSISISGARFEHRNSLHRDADAQGVTASGSYGVYDNIMIYTSNQASGVTNSTDYQFLFDQGSNNNTVTNLYITREAGTLHLSHGIVFKPQSGECHSNVVDGFYLINSKVEIQYGGARDNIVRNGQIWNTTGRSGATSDADYGATAIALANGAHDNLLENIFLYQPTFGIWNNNWSEGEANQGLNNTLVNIVIVEPRQGHLAFQGTGAAQGLNMYNCTFVGGDRLIYTNNSGSGVTGGLYNSIIHEVGSFTNSSSPLSSSFIFDTVNLTSSFANSTLSSYTDSNISNIAFSFVDEATSVFDTFNYSITSTALESGKSFTGTETQQGFDFNETTRTSPFTIGAYEYSGETNPDPDPEPEPSNERRIQLLRFIYD